MYHSSSNLSNLFTIHTLIFRHNLLHLPHNRQIIKSLGYLIQLQFVPEREYEKVLPHLCNHDPGMDGRLGVLLGGKEFFVEFSPSRRLEKSILTSLAPERTIMRLAKSTILTGSPMSKTKISPPWPMVPASNTRRQASGKLDGRLPRSLYRSDR